MMLMNPAMMSNVAARKARPIPRISDLLRLIHEAETDYRPPEKNSHHPDGMSRPDGGRMCRCPSRTSGVTHDVRGSPDGLPRRCAAAPRRRQSWTPPVIDRALSRGWITTLTPRRARALDPSEHKDSRR